MKFLASTLNKFSSISEGRLLQCFLMTCDNVNGRSQTRANEIDFITWKTNQYKGHDFLILFYRMVAGGDWKMYTTEPRKKRRFEY